LNTPRTGSRLDSPPAVPARRQWEKPDEEPIRLASRIPRGFRAPLVSSWPVSSWRIRRTLDLWVLRVALEKERFRLPASTEAEPRKEPMNWPFSQADQPLLNHISVGSSVVGAK
jgi:hypothetical protein